MRAPVGEEVLTDTVLNALSLARPACKWPDFSSFWETFLRNSVLFYGKAGVDIT
jgi:hypothetical protein